MNLFSAVLRFSIKILGALTAVGIMLMVVITCGDVILRWFGKPIIGAFDLVRISGAVAMACALPYTTATKGHVAIEFFYNKFQNLGKKVIEYIVSILGIAFFIILGNESVRMGMNMKMNNQVTATLQVPTFWVAWIIGLCCFLVVLVIVHMLIFPGKELARL